MHGTPTTQTTRDALLAAAAELFADHGFEGASIRMISKRAAANVAAIHYHFGSKENLYVEVFRASCKKESHEPVRRFLEENEGPATIEDVREVIRSSVRSFFRELTSSPEMAVHRRVTLRALMETSVPALDARMDEVLQDDVDDWKSLARRVYPHLSERDLTLWAYGYMGQVVLYFIASDHILRNLELETFDDEFVDAASNFVATSMTTTLLALAQR